MKRLLLCSIALAARTLSVQAQAPTPGNGPSLMYASALSAWHTGPDGIARMNLVGDSTSPTGLSTFRLLYPGKGGDSIKATVHFHMGTEHIIVLRGTLMVGM